MPVTSAGRHIVVVGGGVLGSATAASISAKGLQVTLVTDDPRETTRASAASFAWVNANADTEEYAAFKSAARAEHARQGTGDWFIQTGSDADGRATSEDGYVDVERFIGAQRKRLLAAGGAVRTGVHVRRLQRRGGEVIVDAAGNAETLAVDTVVLAAGTGTAELVRSLGAETRRISTATGLRGFLARVRTDHGLTGIRSVNGLQLRPDGPGILAAQSLTIERDLRARRRATVDTVWKPLRAEIMTALERDISAEATVRIDEAARPMSVDGKPVAGWVADGVYALLSHSGITLAPLLARFVASELSGDHVGRLAPYRPDSLIG